MRGLFRNALFSTAETVCTGIATFLLYYYIVAQLGVKAMGAWSLVMAATSISRVADIGVGNALVRFVPAALARGCKDEAVGLIETALAAIAVLFFVILALAEPVFALVLGALVEPAEQSLVVGILPYAFLSFWLSNVGLVLLSALAGVHRYDQRSMVSMIGMVVQLGTALVLVPYAGLLGLVWCQILQNVVVLLGAWLLLRRHLAVGFLPFRFNFAQLREMFAYGASLQISSIAGLLFEPSTKLILSNVGGLVMVGYYEMASRMVIQVRMLAVSAVQVLAPALAGLHETDKAKAFDAYYRTTQLTWLLTFPLMATFVAFMPAIMEIWLGHRSVEFLTFGLILSVAWTINLLCAPAFFMGIASGELRGNLWGAWIVAIANIVLGTTFGVLWASNGVVLATALALSAGSTFILVFNDRRFGARLGNMFAYSTVIMALFPVFGAVVSIAAYGPVRGRFGIGSAIVESTAVMAVAVGLALRWTPEALLLLKSLRAELAPAGADS